VLTAIWTGPTYIQDITTHTHFQAFEKQALTRSNQQQETFAMDRHSTFLGWEKTPQPRRAPPPLPASPARAPSSSHRLSPYKLKNNPQQQQQQQQQEDDTAADHQKKSPTRSPARARRRLHSVGGGKEKPLRKSVAAAADGGAQAINEGASFSTVCSITPKVLFGQEENPQAREIQTTSHPTTMEWTTDLEWERKYLLQICQDNAQDDCTDTISKWEHILQRVRDFPQVVQPVSLLLRSPTTNPTLGVEKPPDRHQQQQEHVELYAKTILGALCSMDMSVTTAMSGDGDNTSNSRLLEQQKTSVIICDTIRTVLMLCPWQVRCSQVKAGHTPLRDAVCNPSCPPAVLEMLVQADEAVNAATGDTRSVLGIRDPDGLSPVDHLVHTVQLAHHPVHPCQHHHPLLPKQNYTVARLESLLKYARAPEEQKSDSPSSPLLQFLSLGTSFGILPGAAVSTVAAVLPVMTIMPMAAMVEQQHDNTTASRLDRILQCTRLLLRWNPALIRQTSKISGCSPLQVAIRNYGNFVPLVREIIDRDDDGMMRHRNHYGDSPLHVACSVGVPMDVLRLILARTLMADECSEEHHHHHHHPGNSPSASEAAPHSLVWSRNNSGYTPVDLEWIRHIEAGHGFFTHRSFYPLDARGVRRPEGRYDDLYDILLRQAVDQVLEGQSLPTRNARNAIASSSATAQPTTTVSRTDASLRFAGANDSTVGLLLHRIFLVIRASFRDSFSRSPFDLSGDILHQASVLSGPHGPTLPRPVLELIFFQHPEQLERQDHAGKLPLHYAVQLCRAHEDASVKSGEEWKLWVQKLLFHAPESCAVKDHQGRLPLHHALEYPSSSGRSQPEQPAAPMVQEARNTIVKDLVDRCPPTVEEVDPVSKLYPFQLAAANPLISLNTVFSLLRRGPAVMD